MIRLCDYGCGGEAKFQMTSGKWCCEDFYTKCFEFKKNNKGNTGNKCSEETKRKISIGNKGKIVSEDSKRKNRESNIGKVNSEESRKKQSISSTGKKKKRWTEDQKRKLKRNGKNNPMFNKHHSEETKRKIGLNSIKLKHNDQFKKRMRDKMLNGGHKYVSSFIKKISKEEIKLRDMVKKLYPDCIFQHGIFNYAIDVAIPKYKIAVEFDGWFHFDTEEHKEYHKQRQEKIEREGWKFLRYTIFDRFPNLEQVKNDINFIKEMENR